MSDYPDWTRLFYLVGTAITIPINIESSDITLNVNLVGSDIQMDVNIVAAAVTLDFNFADQSVAVFDAAKWFAHAAAQWSAQGQGNVIDGGLVVLVSRTVPAGKVAFVAGIAHSVFAGANVPKSMEGSLAIGGVGAVRQGSQTGGGIALDTPMRATAGQIITLIVFQGGSGATMACVGAMWGYDEDA